jgi:ABC-type glutathione transport system ATPase component
MTTDQRVVEVEHLHKVFGAGKHAVNVVDDVSFTLRPGRTLGLVGESGAGKSTIGAILTGIHSATSGRVVVCGEDRCATARSGRDRLRRGGQLQVVSQDPFTSLDPTQRVASAIAEVVALHDPCGKRERADRVAELLGVAGLSPQHLNVTPRAMSGGQRQRVAIARALAARPAVIVLDEAVSALDVSVQGQILNLLQGLQRSTGTAYLFITHDFGVARQIADDVLVLKAGRVLERGPTDAVLMNPQHEYTKLLLASTPRPGWKPVARGSGNPR